MDKPVRHFQEELEALQGRLLEMGGLAEERVRAAVQGLAARVSDFTAFVWLGRLVEYGRTDKMFTNPSEKLTEDYVTGRFG